MKYSCMHLKTVLTQIQIKYSSTHHVRDLEVAIGEDDGIGGCGHWQHERKGRAERAGNHHIQRVKCHGL